MPCVAYGSYKELAKDPNIDIVYVASPHSHHYQNVRLCFENGKPVLCEKAFTVNAAQARSLYHLARSKQLFLMEAVWTRYFPLSKAIRKHIIEGDLGEVVRVHADLSVGLPPETSFDVSHRMINKNLAGGALLDLGIYSLTWIFQALYHTLRVSKRLAPEVKGVAMAMEPRTGSDEMTSVLLEFPHSAPNGEFKAHATATTAMRLDHATSKHAMTGPTVRIQGTKAEIQVFGLTSTPTKYKLVPWQSHQTAAAGRTPISTCIQEHTFDFPGNGSGLFWEADEAARCWRDGKLESDDMPWRESIVIMETMDEIRRQGGLTYPENIESTDYPLDLDCQRESSR